MPGASEVRECDRLSAWADGNQSYFPLAFQIELIPGE